jgi:hypothetical protein
VQQRGQPQPQVPFQPVPGLQRDGLVEHCQRVPVDVLVPVVLVDLQPERGHLGQEMVGHAGLDQQVDALRRAIRPAGQQQLGQLDGDPLGRDNLQPGCQLGHRPADVGSGGEAQLGHEPGSAQHAQRVVAERVLSGTGSTQDFVAQVGEAAERVHQLVVWQPGGHRVDREIAPGQVVHQRGAVPDVRLARMPLVLLAAVGRDLEVHVALAQPDSAEGDPDRPGGICPVPGDLQHTLRRCVGGQVKVAVHPAQEHVPDQSAD